MGSIAVVACRDGASDIEAVRRALAASPHRGEPVGVMQLDRVAIGCSATSAATDAWIAERGGVAAAFTGSLDNAAELRRDLALEGQDPAQLLLALYERHRRPAPELLRGAFAAAITDGRRVWCFRDHQGFRPLHFRNSGDAFVAATEAKQVTAGAGIPREPDREAVDRSFWGALGKRETVIKGVERMPRANLATLEDGRLGMRRYWDPTPLLESASWSVAEAAERLDALLDRVISRSVTGNDAVLLSGGVDSPAIAAYAAAPHRERGGRSLQAVTRVYPDHPAVDERRYVELIAGELDIELHTYTSQATMLDRVSYWVDVLDGPSNILGVPEVAESYAQVRATGARTAMTGELVEHAFTNVNHMIGHLVLKGRIRPALRWVRRERGRGRPWETIARDVGASLAPSRLALAYTGRRRSTPGKWAWLGAEAVESRPDLAIPVRQRWPRSQLAPFTSDSITFEAADTCAAVEGVIERKPLADVDLWEFALSLRAETKFSYPVWKGLLRRSLRGRLPDVILDRTDKTVFDDAVVDRADWEGLQRWVVDSEQRIDGVDYESVRERIERRDMKPLELIAAYSLARHHAFLDLWS